LGAPVTTHGWGRWWISVSLIGSPSSEEKEKAKNKHGRRGRKVKKQTRTSSYSS
jgi:hypothetical protein